MSRHARSATGILETAHPADGQALGTARNTRRPSQDLNLARVFSRFTRIGVRSTRIRRALSIVDAFRFCRLAVPNPAICRERCAQEWRGSPRHHEMRAFGLNRLGCPSGGGSRWPWGSPSFCRGGAVWLSHRLVPSSRPVRYVQTRARVGRWDDHSSWPPSVGRARHRPRLT
jgi:hypothetical protein